MKFTQLFNWLRFKLTTPFQAMKNRFFIERDSKHRRIMVNFGFTFRNSKWATFAQTNLSSKLPSFWRLNNIILQVILVCVSFFITSIVLVKLNVTTYVFGSELIYSFVELLRTSTSYWFTILITTLSAFLHSVFTFVLNKFFVVDTTTSTSKGGSGYSTDTSINDVSNRDISFTVQLKNIKAGRMTPQIEELFNSTDNNTSLPVGLMYCISDHTLSTTPLTQNSNTSFKDVVEYSTKSFLKNDWNLLSMQSEQVRLDLENASILHNLTDTTFNALNVNITSVPESQTITSLHTKYMNNVKIDRWLYRYSLLHRHSLHKAHDLTLTKRLTSLGMFSGNLTSNNLWASNFVTLTPDLRTTLVSLYKQTYGDVFNTNKATNNPLTNVAFFESSYFWVLKRFYNLNTLDRNSVISTVNVTGAQTLPVKASDLRFYNITDLPTKTNLYDLAVFSSLHLNDNIVATTTNPTNDVFTDVNCTTVTYNLLSGDFISVARSLSSDKLTPDSRHFFFNHNVYSSSISNGTLCTNTQTTQPTFNLLKTIDFK